MSVKNNEGFTLVEVLIAVVLAAMAFVGLYSLSTQCMKQVWAARDASRAVLVGTYEMERLRTIAWSDVVNRGSYTITTENPVFAELLTGGDGTVNLTGSGGERKVSIILSYGSIKAKEVVTGLITSNGFLR